MLSVEQGIISFIEEPNSQTGTVRYAPSFQLAVEGVILIGYAPRMIYDDESGFVILVDNKGAIFYFNLDIVNPESVRKLEVLFGFSLRYYTTHDYTYEEHSKGITEIVYPAHLHGKPLFKDWSWLSPKGFLKNFGYATGTDKPMWERLTDEMQAYLAQQQR